jgi:hypothetical protein
MHTITLYSGTASGAQASQFIPNLITSNTNRNNTGHVQVVGSGTVTIEGSADGTNFIPIVTGVTSTAGQHIAIFPNMRANITTASGTTSVFLVI